MSDTSRDGGIAGAAEPSGLVIIAGAGSGLGAALMRRFSAGGYNVVGLQRTVREGETQTGSGLIPVDAADGSAVVAAVQSAIARHGPPRIVIHNTAELVIRPFLDLDDDDFERCWRSMVLSLVHLARATLPAMRGAGGGAMIVSGATASIRGGANFAAFASAKFALRGLTQSLARGYQADGVHVAHVIIDGILDTAKSRAMHALDPALMLDVADVAEAYWSLAHQPRSAWTHELDLRPASERF